MAELADACHPLIDSSAQSMVDHRWAAGYEIGCCIQIRSQHEPAVDTQGIRILRNKAHRHYDIALMMHRHSS